MRPRWVAPPAPVCCREGLCRRNLDDRRAKTGTFVNLVSAFGSSILEHPPGTRIGGSGTDELAANIVEDMVDDHALRQACGERGDLPMDVSEPSGA
jgi:hypothetical protein